MPLLDGQVGIVSGAAQGLGTAFAKVLSENGAQVVAFDVQQSVTDVVKEIEDATGNAQKLLYASLPG